MRAGRASRVGRILAVCAGAGALGVAALPPNALAQAGMPMGNLFPQMSIFQGATTNSANGDTNPYSLAVVPKTLGNLVAGDVLAVDFNNSSGTFGAGLSIVQINPATGSSSTFYDSTASPTAGPVGIAINPVNDLVWVIYYGSASDGSASGYAVINTTGGMVANFNNSTASYTSPNGTVNHNLFEGSWGAAAAPGAFFWSNAGSASATSSGNTGQVWRVNPNPTGPTNGQPLNSTYMPLAMNLPTSDTSANPITPSTAAGPQGMVYDSGNGTLYVTDDFNNAIYAIPNALSATPGAPVLISQGGALNAPQQIALNPVNGDLLVVDGAGSNQLVEITTSGMQVATRTLDQGASGALFGVATTVNAMGQLVVYFDDANTSTLDTLSGNGAEYSAYQFVRGNGQTQRFGLSASPTGPAVAGNVVGMAYASGSGGMGYWEVTANGMVYALGSAQNYGNVAGIHLDAPIVGMASTPDGKGYWLVAADGGIFNFGDAGFYGNTYTDGLTGLSGSHRLAAPIVGMASTPDGNGYWLVAADGGIFNFGDAGFYGNTYTDGLTGLSGLRPLHKPVIGMAATPDGAGYWLFAADGGVFNFGNAAFSGSGANLGVGYAAASATTL